MVRKRKLTMGKGAIIVSCLPKYIHPSLRVRNHHVNITKGPHQLERITVLQRELKKIRGGKDNIMAIVVTAPRTVEI